MLLGEALRQIVEESLHRRNPVSNRLLQIRHMQTNRTEKANKTTETNGYLCLTRSEEEHTAVVCCISDL